MLTSGINNQIKIRLATQNDFENILLLIKELALYEKCLNEVETSVEQMQKDTHLFNAFVAEYNNKIIGTAIYFNYYSTWKGRCLYLEDIIVNENYRKLGVGKSLFDAVVFKGKEIKAKRIMWQVLAWNTPAIAFYKKLNSHFDDEWLNCKLTEHQIVNYQ